MLAGEALVAMPTWEKDVRRKHRAGLKYKKVEGDKWIIDTGKDRGSVRPIDLVSRNPDRLRKFESKEEAVAFEEECHQEAKKRKAGKAFLTKDPLPRLFAMCKT